MSKLDEILEKWNMSNIPDLKIELQELVDKPPLYFDDVQQFATDLLTEFEKNATQEEFNYLDSIIQRKLANIATGVAPNNTTEEETE